MSSDAAHARRSASNVFASRAACCASQGFFCLDPDTYPRISQGRTDHPRCFDCEQFWVANDPLSWTIRTSSHTVADDSHTDGSWTPSVMGYNLTSAACDSFLSGYSGSTRIVPFNFKDLLGDGLRADYLLDSDAQLAHHCTAFAHCRDTDEWPDSCDYILINRMELHWTQVFLLVVIGSMLAVPLAQDMDQAAVEEAVLHFHTRGKRWHLSHSVLRTGLRIRRLVMPVMAAATGAGVLMSESLSAQSILLNVLAVAFVTEFDDMLAALLISPAQAKHAEPYLRGVPDDGRSLMVEKFNGMLCAIVMIVCCYCSTDLIGWMPTAMRAFGLEIPGSGLLPCNRVQEAMQCQHHACVASRTSCPLLMRWAVFASYARARLITRPPRPCLCAVLSIFMPYPLVIMHVARTAYLGRGATTKQVTILCAFEVFSSLSGLWLSASVFFAGGGIQGSLLRSVDEPSLRF